MVVWEELGVCVTDFRKNAVSWLDFFVECNKEIQVFVDEASGLEVVAMLLWSIWESRNNLIFQNKEGSVVDCLDQVLY